MTRPRTLHRGASRLSGALSQFPDRPLSLFRVSVRVPAAEAEIARARFLTLAPTGFEEVDLGNEVELAAYTDEAGEEEIRSAFGGRASSEPTLPGWEERWRAFHRPVRAAGIWIGPPWETPPPGEPAVVVDPGRAFGTGAHPTTRACIELLAGLDRCSILDAGTGSGVIAVAAARLGFEPVFALDVDLDAIEVASATARQNDAAVRIRQADVLTDALPKVELVVANIELSAVEALLARRPGRASGHVRISRPRGTMGERLGGGFPCRDRRLSG